MKPEKIFITSNRLPVTVVRTVEGFKVKPSNGGLATALQSVFGQQNSYWIGWPGIILNDKTEEQQVTELLTPLGFIPVFLSQAEFDGYYSGFSNAILWPLFHYHPGHCLFKPEYWDSYVQVNQKFAKVINEQVPKNDFVWIHDYQLMLLPSFLNHPHLSYFHHIPFPASEIFGIIPWRNELLDALLHCKHLVFQTEKDGINFQRTCERYASPKYIDDVTQTLLPSIKIAAHPISIDAFSFEQTAKKSSVLNRSEEIRKVFHNQKIFLSVDRLDYSKGILERLAAFNLLLQDFPKYRGQVVLIMLIVPSRSEVPSYEEHKRKVDEMVGKINAEFANLDWRPVHYHYQQTDRDELCAYYKAADICLITSLRDGLNLVSKEYIACQTNNEGVLILSEMAGAAEELRYALKVHPYNIKQMVMSISYALEMDESERRARMETLRNQIFGYTVFDWLHKIFQEVFLQYNHLNFTFEQNLNADLVENIRLKFRQAQQRVILLDYDGCLRKLEPHPQLATPSKELIQLLCNLNALPETTVALVSGRSRTDMEEWFGNCGIILIAEHGAWYKHSATDWEPYGTEMGQYRNKIYNFLKKHIVEGTYLEEKKVGYCLHYKQCKPSVALSLQSTLEKEFQHYRETEKIPCRYMISNNHFEILPQILNKGNAVKKFISFNNESFILAAGDDDTDEDLFAVLPKSAFTFKIGRKATKAKVRIAEIERFIGLLSDLADDKVRY